MWNVSIIDDDTTPNGYIADMLEALFGKTHDEAVKMLFERRDKGRCLVCSYPTREEAWKKVEFGRNAAFAMKFDDFNLIMEEARPSA